MPEQRQLWSNTYPGGDHYTGEVVHGRIKQGLGAYTWQTTGAKYHGHWMQDVPRGTGILIMPGKTEGYVYVGEFDKGIRSGQGVCSFTTGRLYCGAWEQNAMHGVGVLRGAPQTDDFVEYVGPFVQGLRHGTGGTCMYHNGDMYVGTWRLGKREGWGELRLAARPVRADEALAPTSSPRSRATGATTTSQPRGRSESAHAHSDNCSVNSKAACSVGAGTDESTVEEEDLFAMDLAEKDSNASELKLYEGLFHDDQPQRCRDGIDDSDGATDARTRMTYRDGSRYTGDAVAMRRHGHGELRWPDGTVYVGSFAHDERDGHGVWHCRDGLRRYDGVWKRNVLHGTVTYTRDGGNAKSHHYQQPLSLCGIVKYVGEVAVGVFAGSDVEVWYADGAHYRGGFEASRPDGQGVLSYPAGPKRGMCDGATLLVEGRELWVTGQTSSRVHASHVGEDGCADGHPDRHESRVQSGQDVPLRGCSTQPPPPEAIRMWCTHYRGAWRDGLFHGHGRGELRVAECRSNGGDNEAQILTTSSAPTLQMVPNDAAVHRATAKDSRDWPNRHASHHGDETLLFRPGVSCGFHISYHRSGRYTGPWWRGVPDTRQNHAHARSDGEDCCVPLRPSEDSDGGSGPTKEGRVLGEMSVLEHGTDDDEIPHASRRPPCQGEWIWEDGSCYVGDVWEGVAHGWGHYSHACGSSRDANVLWEYAGEFRNGQSSGWGCYHDRREERRYVGQWRCGWASGRGGQLWVKHDVPHSSRAEHRQPGTIDGARDGSEDLNRKREDEGCVWVLYSGEWAKGRLCGLGYEGRCSAESAMTAVWEAAMSRARAGARRGRADDSNPPRRGDDTHDPRCRSNSSEDSGCCASHGNTGNKSIDTNTGIGTRNNEDGHCGVVGDVQAKSDAPLSTSLPDKATDGPENTAVDCVVHYTGSYLDGLRHGHGVAYYSDLSTTAHCSLTCNASPGLQTAWASLDTVREEGVFSHGWFCGPGERTLRSGIALSGCFDEQGRLHRCCQIHLAHDAAVFDGVFEHGELNGNVGTIRYGNGDWYRGAVGWLDGDDEGAGRDTACGDETSAVATIAMTALTTPTAAEITSIASDCGTNASTVASTAQKKQASTTATRTRLLATCHAPRNERWMGTFPCRDGQGVYTFAEGHTLSCTWQRNILHGEGVYTNATTQEKSHRHYVEGVLVANHVAATTAEAVNVFTPGNEFPNTQSEAAARLNSLRRMSHGPSRVNGTGQKGATCPSSSSGSGGSSSKLAILKRRSACARAEADGVKSNQSTAPPSAVESVAESAASHAVSSSSTSSSSGSTAAVTASSSSSSSTSVNTATMRGYAPAPKSVRVLLGRRSAAVRQKTNVNQQHAEATVQTHPRRSAENITTSSNTPRRTSTSTHGSNPVNYNSKHNSNSKITMHSVDAASSCSLARSPVCSSDSRASVRAFQQAIAGLRCTFPEASPPSLTSSASTKMYPTHRSSSLVNGCAMNAQNIFAPWKTTRGSTHDPCTVALRGEMKVLMAEASAIRSPQEDLIHTLTEEMRGINEEVWQRQFVQSTCKTDSTGVPERLAERLSKLMQMRRATAQKLMRALELDESSGQS